MLILSVDTIEMDIVEYSDRHVGSLERDRRRCGMILTYIMFFLLAIMFFLLGMVAQVLLDKLEKRLKKELGEGEENV